MSITSSELRSKYIEFFVERNHVAIPSASLVPANDPTVLFTTAGMHPLVPNLLGEPHPAGTRLVDVQKCIRTGDIDEIGDATHLSFFEMLGNWSLGDYFRDDAIRWSFEFLTEPRWLGLPIERLGVTCFAGDDEVPCDDASARIWERLGIRNIRFLGRDDNWWGPAGRTGPCGPDTEVFFDDIEIWNNVFMGYAKTASGAIEPLARANVDTGMGLERTLVALNGHRSVYEVDTVAPIYATLRELALEPRDRELRVMTDHLRAACFAIGDGVVPANKDRGYVVRRLLRRCILFAQRLGMPAGWHEGGVACVVAVLGGAYPELEGFSIAAVISDEIDRFSRTLAQGLRVLEKQRDIDAFDLFQTYGFPLELTIELAQGKRVDRERFAAQLAEHRAKSRGAGGAFEGGLADHSDAIVRYHTVTHLLQAALRVVLGDGVIQRGSNITRERLRFDYSHEGKPTPDQLARVEALVNDWLARELVVDRATMPEPEARALGAIGAFGEKYGDVVSVYTIRDAVSGEVLSREFCGGPHTREVRGRFRITREQALAAGVRRIKAVVE